MAPVLARPSSRRRARFLRAAGLALLPGLAVIVWWLPGGRSPQPYREGPFDSSAQAVARGEYLARAGNCFGCHESDDGTPLAGGRGIETPFGTVYASNITPDDATGIGRWSRADFWRALHEGRSRNGRLLYPAFPYPSYTQVTQADADALYAFLRTVRPVSRPARGHALRFPYGTQPALSAWRALYFEPGGGEADPGRGAKWNRGRYLVQALGHCAACHTSRNWLGGNSLRSEFLGGPMPDQAWYAPSLADPAEAGVQQWSREDVVALLQRGTTDHASVAGPMADVVFYGTQYLTTGDLEAMAEFLTTLPIRAAPSAAEAARAPPEPLQRGGRLYERHCAACHGEQGQGVAGIYPALSGNRAVLLQTPANLVQMIRHGGFAPSTAGHPRPFGMPPFGQMLSSAEIADLATYLRQSWGHAGKTVSPLEVSRIR